MIKDHTTNLPKSDYCIKPGYAHRSERSYFEDSQTCSLGVVHQPDIYPFSAYLARHLGCTYILDIGCGRAKKLIELHPEFQIIGVDYGPNLNYCRNAYHFGTWIDHDLETVLHPFLPQAALKKTLVICSDVIEHLAHPEHILETLSLHLEFIPAAVISTPERDLVRGTSDTGPPANPSHIREWNREELTSLLRKAGMNIGFVGLSINNDKDRQKKTTIAVVHNKSFPQPTHAPEEFRVTAIMTAYNEADIILPSIRRLLTQGIRVHLIDNWSDDATAAVVKPLVDEALITYERFPPTGPERYYEWRKLLARVEDLSSTLASDWFIHHDVDEIRHCPWLGFSLLDGIYIADKAGYNAIDHSVIEFSPINNDYISGTDFGEHFSYWDFGRRPGHFLQIKAWKNVGLRADLKSSGGHQAAFSGRRVFPYKFLLCHYPIRTDEQGKRKVFTERLDRYSPAERADGLHIQYDCISRSHDFICEARLLNCFIPSEIYVENLIEMISGIGIIQQPISTERSPDREPKWRKLKSTIRSWVSRNWP